MSKTIFSIMTLRIIGFFATLRIKDTGIMSLNVTLSITAVRSIILSMTNAECQNAK